MRPSRNVKSAALLAGLYRLVESRVGAATSPHADVAAYVAVERLSGPWRSTREWEPRDFRLSEGDFCHDRGSEIRIRSCWDPDGILTAQGPTAAGDGSLEALDRSLQRETFFVSPCPEHGQRGELVPLQVAVALVSKMKIDGVDDASSIDKTVEAFARSIHDQWGVGQETRCGGTGVLIFVSVQDRAIYVSRGDALKRILTNRRLDTVIGDVSPYLQHQLYVSALVNAIEEIRVLVMSGEVGFGERLLDLLSYYSGFLWIFGIFNLVFWSNRRRERRKREYAKVKSCLSEIDRAKAEALQGRFAAVSCPICLEAFQKKSLDDENETLIEKSQQAHRPLGSDGLPLRLLRCGHVFDETCWTEWTDSGRGEVHKCPICKADVGKPLEEVASPLDGVNETISADTSASTRPSANSSSTPPRAVMARYEDERNFRLRRLHHRYPQILRPDLLDRWTRNTDSAPLATDARLTELDPSQNHMDRTCSLHNRHGNASQSGFSGGTSGGGRVGRW